MILITSLRRRLGNFILDGLAKTLAKTLVASLFMSAAVVISLWISKTWPGVFKLLVTVPSAVAVYLLAAKLLRIEELALLTGGRANNK